MFAYRCSGSSSAVKAGPEIDGCDAGDWLQPVPGRRDHGGRRVHRNHARRPVHEQHGARRDHPRRFLQADDGRNPHRTGEDGRVRGAGAGIGGERREP